MWPMWDDVGPQRAAVADDGGVNDGGVADGAGQRCGEPPLEVLADLLAVVAEAATLFEGALGLATSDAVVGAPVGRCERP